MNFFDLKGKTALITGTSQGLGERIAHTLAEIGAKGWWRCLLGWGDSMKITREELYSLIYEPYLSRGEAYYKEGLVELISIKPQQVDARAAGTRVYKVSLKRKGYEINGHCTCPAFEDFGPCKHMAAVGFALIKHSEGTYKPSDEYFDRTKFFNEIERSLSKQTKEALISFILRLITDYPEIMEMLEEELWPLSTSTIF
jgi:hypothetical protein